MVDLRQALQDALGDRYRIERELGRGGMAVVYLAEDRKHERPVALKVLPPELAMALGAERFLREIRIVAHLHHPNILTLLDSGEAAGVMYYVTPYVAGESLRHRLDREKQLPLADVCRIASEVADALSYAHEQGIIHRDIKPENILLEGGHAVVADFGIARALAEMGSDKLTATGIAVGTLAYMSPEQASGELVDGRADVYALGCVTYEMLAGAPPFTGPTPQAILARKAVETAPDLRALRGRVSPDLGAVIEKALARLPADRFATAREMADALSGNAPPPIRRSRGHGTAGRRKIVLSALGIGLLLTAGYSLVGRNGLRGASAPPIRTAFRQLTGQPGLEVNPSLSPDGGWIVYSGEGAGNRDIYLQGVSGQTAINLTADSPGEDVQPAFSPDGERIAFRSTREGGGIFVMGRTGEAVKRVTRTGFNPSWSPDGSRLAYATEGVDLNPMNWNGTSEIWIADAATGQGRRLEVENAVQPTWSPDGKRVAFAARLANRRKMDIWTVPTDGGAAAPVTDDEPTDWNPVWAPDGKHIYFVSDRGGSMNLWRVAVDPRSGTAEGPPEAVTTPAPFVGHLSVSADGHRLVYASVLLNMNIQRLALDPSTAAVRGEPFSVTTGSRSWANPDVTPDGAWVAFYSRVGPEGDLYVVRADGTGLRQVTSDSAIDRVPRWSPDGQWITHFSDRSGRFELWNVRRDGSELHQLTDIGGVYATWSPDGTKIITTSAANADDAVVYIFDPYRPPGEDNRQVLKGIVDARSGFVATSWSPDGKLIAGQLGLNGKGIALYDLRTGKYQRILEFGEWPAWLPDSRRLVFVVNGKEFDVVDARTREIRKIWSVTRDVIGPPRVTGDGRALYFSRRGSEADIWLLTMQ